MSFSSFLYTLIIYPIKLILECFYTLFSRFIEGDNGGGVLYNWIKLCCNAYNSSDLYCRGKMGRKGA